MEEDISLQKDKFNMNNTIKVNKMLTEGNLTFKEKYKFNDEVELMMLPITSEFSRVLNYTGISKRFTIYYTMKMYLKKHYSKEGQQVRFAAVDYNTNEIYITKWCNKPGNARAILMKEIAG